MCTSSPQSGNSEGGHRRTLRRLPVPRRLPGNDAVPAGVSDGTRRRRTDGPGTLPLRVGRERSDVRRRTANLHAGRGRLGQVRSRQPSHPDGGHGQRWRDGQADDLRGQAIVAPRRPAARKQGHHRGDEHAGSLQLRGHRRRRRFRQEGTLVRRRQARREPRAPTERPDLGDRQLDLPHLRHLPRPAARREGREGRLSWRGTVGTDE